MATNYVTLPLFSDVYYEYSITLEGNSYILQFVYNEKASLYFMSLFDAERTPIILGEALLPTYPLLKDYALENLTGWFWLEEKADIAAEPYKEFPDKLNEFYNFFYIYLTED